jgi:hypothetical protein
MANPDWQSIHPIVYAFSAKRDLVPSIESRDRSFSSVQYRFRILQFATSGCLHLAQSRNKS